MNNKSTFLDGLNQDQSKAVNHYEGPLLVVAGAGIKVAKHGKL